MGDIVPTIYDKNVKWFSNWKKEMGLDSSKRIFKTRDVKVRPLINVPESIPLEKLENPDRYVCGPGEHILLDFERGIRVVSEEV